MSSRRRSSSTSSRNRRSFRRRSWRQSSSFLQCATGALIVGYGSIGRCTGQLLEALGVDVQGVASKARSGVHGIEDLESLLGRADIVVVLVPLTDATHGLFDAGMLSRVRSGALLLNAARGPVIDTSALLDELSSERIRAALDVTDPEPLPPEHPLWDAPGVLITPHLAGDSSQAEERVYRLIGDQIRRYVAGEPLVNVVERLPVEALIDPDALVGP